MHDIIQIEDRYYILATSSLAETQDRVLKHAELFAIFDSQGGIRPLGFEDHGIYFEGTRFLSRLLMNLQGKRPLLLSSTVKENNDFLAVDLTNPEFQDAPGNKIHHGALHLFRSICATTRAGLKPPTNSSTTGSTGRRPTCS